MSGTYGSDCGDETREPLRPAARLLGRAGRSERSEWRFYTDGMVRHLVIGSSSSCDWRVHARGVHSRHLRLCWSGDRLRLEDQVALGSVRVDGRPVAHRLDLAERSVLEFGEARLGFERLGAPLAGVEAPTFDAITPVRGAARSPRKWWPILGVFVAVVVLHALVGR